MNKELKDFIIQHLSDCYPLSDFLWYIFFRLDLRADPLALTTSKQRMMIVNELLDEGEIELTYDRKLRRVKQNED